MPSIERPRCCGSDLNQAPVSNERECNVSVRQWTADDEMIVAMHQNTDHATSYLEARIGNRITDREMVHHMSLLGRQVEIIVHLVIVKRADASRPESERLRGEIQAVTDGACFEMHIAITTVSMGADGTLDIADHRERHACVAGEILREA